MSKMKYFVLFIALFSLQSNANELVPAIEPAEMEALIGIDMAKLMYLNKECNVPVIVGKATLVELARVRAISEGYFSINSLS